MITFTFLQKAKNKKMVHQQNNSNFPGDKLKGGPDDSKIFTNFYAKETSTIFFCHKAVPFCHSSTFYIFKCISLACTITTSCWLYRFTLGEYQALYHTLQCHRFYLYDGLSTFIKTLKSQFLELKAVVDRYTKGVMICLANSVNLSRLF